jgi:hypothetical protein
MSEPLDREPPASADENTPVAPWQQVAPGRYQPRRTRGSCLGRELG